MKTSLRNGCLFDQLEASVKNLSCLDEDLSENCLDLYGSYVLLWWNEESVKIDEDIWENCVRF